MTTNASHLFGREGAIDYAPMARLWTDDLIVFTNGTDIRAGDAESLAANHVRVHTEPIRRLESEQGRLTAVLLDGGNASSETPASSATSTPAPLRPSPKSSASPAHRTSGAGHHSTRMTPAEGAACAETIVHAIASEPWSHQ